MEKIETHQLRLYSDCGRGGRTLLMGLVDDWGCVWMARSWGWAGMEYLKGDKVATVFYTLYHYHLTIATSNLIMYEISRPHRS